MWRIFFGVVNRMLDVSYSLPSESLVGGTQSCYFAWKCRGTSCEYEIIITNKIHNVRSETKSVSEANRTDHVSEGNKNYYKMNTTQ